MNEFDYKNEIQQEAERLADTIHGKDFYALDDETRMEVFKQAQENIRDREILRAEAHVAMKAEQIGTPLSRLLEGK